MNPAKLACCLFGALALIVTLYFYEHSKSTSEAGVAQRAQKSIKADTYGIALVQKGGADDEKTISVLVKKKFGIPELKFEFRLICSVDDVPWTRDEYATAFHTDYQGFRVKIEHSHWVYAIRVKSEVHLSTSKDMETPFDDEIIVNLRTFIDRGGMTDPAEKYLEHRVYSIADKLGEDERMVVFDVGPSRDTSNATSSNAKSDDNGDLGANEWIKADTYGFALVPYGGSDNDDQNAITELVKKKFGIQEPKLEYAKIICLVNGVSQTEQQWVFAFLVKLGGKPSKSKQIETLFDDGIIDKLRTLIDTRNISSGGTTDPAEEYLDRRGYSIADKLRKNDNLIFVAQKSDGP
eukprot:912563_1